MTPDKPQLRPASYLSPPDFHRLDWACVPVDKAFKEEAYGVYLVGSVLARPDYRDIDLRLILRRDEKPPSDGVRLLMQVAISGMIQASSGLRAPIDFQIQTYVEANDDPANKGFRNPMGCRLPGD